MKQITIFKNKDGWDGKKEVKTYWAIYTKCKNIGPFIKK